MALTHHQQLMVTGTTYLQGPVIATANGDTLALGTASVTNLTSTTASITGLTIAGTLTGASTWCGTRVIATGGSATISCVNSATRPIIVTPLFTATSGTGVRRRIATVVNRSASAFKVMISSPSGTGMTGTVQWMAVNA